MYYIVVLLSQCFVAFLTFQGHIFAIVQRSCHIRSHHTVAVCRMVRPGTELRFRKCVPLIEHHYG